MEDEQPMQDTGGASSPESFPDRFPVMLTVDEMERLTAMVKAEFAFLNAGAAAHALEHGEYEHEYERLRKAFDPALTELDRARSRAAGYGALALAAAVGDFYGLHVRAVVEAMLGGKRPVMLTPDQIEVLFAHAGRARQWMEATQNPDAFDLIGGLAALEEAMRAA